MTIRHFFGIVAIRLQSVARRAARQRRTNKLEEEDTTGANRKAQRSLVQAAGSRPQYPSSRVATGLFIARTAIKPRRGAVPGEEIAGVTVKTASPVILQLYDERFGVRPRFLSSF